MYHVVYCGIELRLATFFSSSSSSTWIFSTRYKGFYSIHLHAAQLHAPGVCSNIPAEHEELHLLVCHTGMFFYIISVALSYFILPFAKAQQLSPFQGQGWPPEGKTTVFISTVIDRLLSVDDINYRFEVVLYVYLSWTDKRAFPVMMNSSEAAALNKSCQMPCTSTYMWIPGEECCDGVYLPHFEFTNVRGFSQDRVVRYGIAFKRDSPGVSWWHHVQGEFYTPLSFKSFPFDTQQLVVQVEYGHQQAMPGANGSMQLSEVSIKPSLTGLEMYQPRSGDMVSGWQVRSLQILPFSSSFSSHVLSGSTSSDPGDPFPLDRNNPLEKDMEGAASNVTGFNVIISVERDSGYYIISAILPVAINVLLALLVFAVHPKNLDTRLGVVVTLFLSLTAIQFVVSTYLPSSSTVVPTQQLVIVSYCLLAIIGFCSILVYSMVTFRERHRQRKQQKQASREFSKRWKTFVTAATMKHQDVEAARTGLRWWCCPGQQQAPMPLEQVEVAAPGAQQAGQLPGGDERVNGADDEEGCQASQPHPSHTLHPTLAAPKVRRVGLVQKSATLTDGLGSDTDTTPLPFPAPLSGTHHYREGWWLLRWASCCMEVGRGRQQWRRMSWLQLQRLKVAEMAVEMERNPDYSVYLAMRVDRFLFWFIMVGYVLSIILIFALQANQDPEISFS